MNTIYIDPFKIWGLPKRHVRDWSSCREQPTKIFFLMRILWANNTRRLFVPRSRRQTQTATQRNKWMHFQIILATAISSVFYRKRGWTQTRRGKPLYKTGRRFPTWNFGTGSGRKCCFSCLLGMRKTSFVDGVRSWLHADILRENSSPASAS